MKIKNLFYLAMTALVMTLSPAISSAAINQEFYILNAEAVDFSESSLDGASGEEKSLSFTAFGKNFDLALKQRDDLMGRFSSKSTDIKLYSGEIQGVDNSWARLTVVGDRYTGAIFDGAELFILDEGKNIADTLPYDSDDMQNVKTAIYKAAEVSTDLTCGSTHDHDSKFSYKNLLSGATAEQFSSVATATDETISAATATRQINLRIIADTLYAASSPNGTDAQVLSQMNIVDGIFTEQLGVQFGITEIEELNNDGPLTSFDASTLLTQFRNFVGNDNPGLAHLFTGRNINGGTIGIAFVSAICRNAGVGLTQAGGRGTVGALTAAHEFGHNFGAPHDNQGGSVCASTPGTFLMNPSINGSNEFSQCSVTQMQNVLARSTCLVDVDNTPEPTPAPAPAPAPTPESNVVQLVKRNATGFAVDGMDGAANGQNVHLWSTNRNNTNQRWIEIDRGNGFYSYQKQGTSHCLDGNNGGADRQNVHLWICGVNNQNQHWEKVDVGSGFVQLRKRNARGFALDGGSGGARGQNVQIFDSSNTSQNLHWRIDILTTVSPAFVRCADENGTCLLSGPATVRYGADGQFVQQSFSGGSVSCTNTVFGDPIRGTVKSCDFLSQ